MHERAGFGGGLVGVAVGDGAITGAGSVITADVPANSLGLERAEQVQKGGWAAQFRLRKKAEKEAAEAPHSTDAVGKTPVRRNKEN